jgi:hypothetical protein
MKFSMTRKGWPFNTGDCLIEVTTWAGLTVYIYLFTHLVSFHHVPKQLYDIFSDVFFNTVKTYHL